MLRRLITAILPQPSCPAMRARRLFAYGYPKAGAMLARCYVEKEIRRIMLDNHKHNKRWNMNQMTSRLAHLRVIDKHTEKRINSFYRKASRISHGTNSPSNVCYSLISECIQLKTIFQGIN